VKLLLDTHLLLWAAEDIDRVPKIAREAMANPENELVFSVASVWEVAIKTTVRRDNVHANARLFRRALLDNGYTELPITGEHVLATAALPDIHKDPFDRILVAQATAEGITLLTADAVVASYPGPIRTVTARR
jgi:PIN domain nuclease of toxin-antitoxin system